MTETLLVSEQTIKKYTAINENVDSKYVYTSIRQVQDIDLDTIIGPALNKKLQNLVKTGEISDETNKHYKDLLDNWITPYMCAQVTSAIQIYINYKLVNSGVIQNDDERRSHIDYQANKSLMSQYEKYANAYAQKLKLHLCNNSNLYPEYHQVVDFQGEEEPQLCSIFLGDGMSSTQRHNYIGK